MDHGAPHMNTDINLDEWDVVSGSKEYEPGKEIRWIPHRALQMEEKDLISAT